MFNIGRTVRSGLVSLLLLFSGVFSSASAFAYTQQDLAWAETAVTMAQDRVFAASDPGTLQMERDAELNRLINNYYYGRDILCRDQRDAESYMTCIDNYYAEYQTGHDDAWHLYYSGMIEYEEAKLAYQIARNEYDKIWAELNCGVTVSCS